MILMGWRSWATTSGEANNLGYIMQNIYIK